MLQARKYSWLDEKIRGAEVLRVVTIYGLKKEYAILLLESAGEPQNRLQRVQKAKVAK